MIIRIRDKKHKHYGQKCEIKRINKHRDEITLETQSHNQRKIYFDGPVHVSQKSFKRVVPTTIGLRVMILPVKSDSGKRNYHIGKV